MPSHTLDAVLSEVKQTLGIVPEWVNEVPPPARPGLWQQMRDFQLAETIIPNKYKELIGLAVSGATRCHYCTLFHTEAARLFGASEAEISEASMMGGLTMQVSTFLNTKQIDRDHFVKETKQIVDHVRKNLKKPTRVGAQA